MEIQVGKYKHPAPASKFKHTVHCTAVTAHSCIISDMQNLQGQTQMQAQASDVLGNTCKVPVWMVICHCISIHKCGYFGSCCCANVFACVWHICKQAFNVGPIHDNYLTHRYTQIPGVKLMPFHTGMQIAPSEQDHLT